MSRKRTILSFWILLAFLVLPAGVFAQGTTLQDQTEAFAGPDGAGYTDEYRSVPEDPRYLIGLFLNVFVSFLGIGLVGYTVYGGYLVMTGGGVEERITKGRKTIYYALLGAVVIMTAYAITWYVFTIATGDEAHRGSGVWIADDNEVPRDILGEAPSDRTTFCWWIFCNDQ